ncbi:MAG: hypothetical protein IKN13_02975 [Bacteroidales bacterium]|nr:hypothetical protein [Bacteroidales bacterium]
MNKPSLIKIWIAAVLVAAAAALSVVSLTTDASANSESAASAFGKSVEKRLEMLEKYMAAAPESLPQDMVIYRYREDTLERWTNQFPLRSDDIRPSTLVRRIGETRGDAISPLLQAGPEWSYVNIGPKWYLLKCEEADGGKTIAGLEIVNELRAGSISGINSRISSNDRFVITTLAESSGTPVLVQGRPLFKIDVRDAAPGSDRRNLRLQLLSTLFIVIASMLVLSARQSPISFAICFTIQVILVMLVYISGRAAGASSVQAFSPLLYADGPVFYSLGALLSVMVLPLLLSTDLALVRKSLLRKVRERDSMKLEAALAAAGTLLVLGTLLFFHLAFKSVIVNSDICLELYKVPRLSRFTALVYVSFMALALSVVPVVQIISPFWRRLAGVRYNAFGVLSKALFSVLIGVYFVSVSAREGFRKEERRVEVTANRLAMDRDVSLEIRLRMAEDGIAADDVFGQMASSGANTEILLGRLLGDHLGSLTQDYDVSVATSADISLFRERIREGTALSPGSHFYYSKKAGRVFYTGLFSWYSPGTGPAYMFVTVEPKHNREDRGYLRLLGVQAPGRISIPPIYSWAKYEDHRLVRYNGSYGYPTVDSGPMKDGWVHFIHDISDYETVIISRPATTLTDYIVSGTLLAAIAFILLGLMSVKRRSENTSRYYRTRIYLVITVSLTLALVAMAGFSIWFVNKRNTADMQSVMVSRVTTLQGMLQTRLRGIPGDDLPSLRAAIEEVGNSLRCDVTLFSPEGRALVSTTPEVYERMVLGHRMESSAYRNIMETHSRYYLQRERAGKRHFYAMYAPVLDASGNTRFILSSPFLNPTQDFETEAVVHIASVLAIFLLLLIVSRIVSFGMIARLFRPITEISRKMKVSDIDRLEPVSYDSEDEITPLVNAYNRMVTDLRDSSRRLAQAERDKAWTDMARRVAHDLKNPLTPIKLQIQMLIRMKSSGNPSWQERFDEVAATVLYHVDLLADSADQFSTFAKMYDQAAEPIDLDLLLRQEVELFNSREDVSIEYFGFAGAAIKGPRPQLTRVVVNLITNAIQAIEENPGEKRILVSLRNSSSEGFYDIVVEDNGPGVDRQLQDKIFTPDFTTKTSGSGLGLAICRRITEHCGGSISYSRSFALGGACFTVKYPK